MRLTCVLSCIFGAVFKCTISKYFYALQDFNPTRYKPFVMWKVLPPLPLNHYPGSILQLRCRVVLLPTYCYFCWCCLYFPWMDAGVAALPFYV